jgi:hypothetical protein
VNVDVGELKRPWTREEADAYAQGYFIKASESFEYFRRVMRPCRLHRARSSLA